MKPKVLSSETIYKGHVFDLSVAQIQEENVTYERAIITHPGSAVIVPVFADMTVALVRQYRYPAQKYLLELPAGSLEAGEDAEIGARRELEEEVGVTAGKFEKLTEFYVSPGFLGEKMFVFLATELTEVGQKLEADELLKIERIPLADCRDLILKNEIEDAKTMIGLTLTAVKLGISFF